MMVNGCNFKDDFAEKIILDFYNNKISFERLLETFYGKMFIRENFGFFFLRMSPDFDLFKNLYKINPTDYLCDSVCSEIQKLRLYITKGIIPLEQNQLDEFATLINNINNINKTKQMLVNEV